MAKDQRSQLLQGFFRIGAFVGLTGLILVFLQPRESPEFVVSVCSAAIGGALMLAAWLFMRLTR